MIAEEAKKLASSSVYRFGDALGFKVPINDEVSLPGRHNPRHYCAGMENPGRVAVVCPGNGGLVTQLMLLGATEVVAIEPRARFHEAIKATVKLFIQANPGKQVQVFTALPTEAAHLEPLGKFDWIVWPESVDEIGDPSVLSLVARLLKPAGRMKIEVVHGTSTHTDGKINSWRPTPECWLEVMSKSAKVSAPMPARVGTYKTYLVTEPKVLVVEKATPVVEKAAPPMEPIKSVLPEVPTPVAVETPPSLTPPKSEPTQKSNAPMVMERKVELPKPNKDAEGRMTLTPTNKPPEPPIASVGNDDLDRSIYTRSKKKH